VSSARQLAAAGEHGLHDAVPCRAGGPHVDRVTGAEVSDLPSHRPVTTTGAVPVPPVYAGAGAAALLAAVLLLLRRRSVRRRNRVRRR
jgi:hypothetical protein